MANDAALDSRLIRAALLRLIGLFVTMCLSFSSALGGRPEANSLVIELEE